MTRKEGPVTLWHSGCAGAWTVDVTAEPDRCLVEILKVRLVSKQRLAVFSKQGHGSDSWALSLECRNSPRHSANTWVELSQ